MNTRDRRGLYLADERDKVGHDAAETDSRQEAQHDELRHRRRKAGGERERREIEGGDDQHRAPADPVSEDAEEEGAHQDADETRARNRAHLRSGQPELASDLEGDIADGLHVEAVHDETGRAEDEDADLKAADPALVDGVGDVDGIGPVHSVSSAGVVRLAPDATYQALAPTFAAAPLWWASPRTVAPSHLRSVAPSHRRTLAPSHLVYVFPISARTRRAPATIARILPSATSRGRYFSPQSGATTSWRDRRRVSRGECAPPPSRRSRSRASRGRARRG